jgi:hypothetical protein
VDGDAARRVLLDVLAIRTRLPSAVLALPLEPGRADEGVLVLEVRGMAGLIERDQQEEVAGALGPRQCALR